MFYIECSTISKRYRKKLKKKYSHKVNFLTKSRRLHKGLDLIAKSTYTIKNFNFLERLLITYLDLILNFKESDPYKKKILIYKKILKI